MSSAGPTAGMASRPRIFDALRQAGARTAIVAPGEMADPAELLEPFDGLLLVGGGDVDPVRYGAERGAHNYGVDPERDAFEIALLHAADRAAMPTLCICRGAQVLNVAFGGTLHQHLPDIEGLLKHGVPLEGTETMHDVEAAQETKLGGATTVSTLRCSSHHHQGIADVGAGLTVAARSSDGLVEAIERDMTEPGWLVGVQWHPEETAPTDPSQQALFDALVRRAGDRAVSAGAS